MGDGGNVRCNDTAGDIITFTTTVQSNVGARFFLDGKKKFEFLIKSLSLPVTTKCTDKWKLCTLFDIPNICPFRLWRLICGEKENDFKFKGFFLFTI